MKIQWATHLQCKFCYRILHSIKLKEKVLTHEWGVLSNSWVSRECLGTSKRTHSSRAEAQRLPLPNLHTNPEQEGQTGFSLKANSDGTVCGLHVDLRLWSNAGENHDWQCLFGSGFPSVCHLWTTDRNLSTCNRGTRLNERVRLDQSVSLSVQFSRSVVSDSLQPHELQ